MNRREFLLGLLSTPLGWKALFRKKDKKIDELRGVGGFTWSAETGYLTNVDEDKWSQCVEIMAEDAMLEEGGSFHWVQGIPIQPDEPGTFAGLDKVINTGWEEDKWLGLDDMDPVELSYSPAPSEPPLEMDGIRVDGQDVVTGPISNLVDWGKYSEVTFRHSPDLTWDWSLGNDGSFISCRDPKSGKWYQAEIIENDGEAMTIKWSWESA